MSDTAAALWQQAEARARAGDPVGAEAACTALLRIEPGHSRAHLMLASLLMRRDAVREACAHALRAAQRMGPQPLEHIAAVSLRLIACGEYEQASQLIHRLDPARVPAPGILVELSQQLGMLEEHADSLRYLDAAIAGGVQAESIGYLRGNTLKFLGRLDEAAEEYERSLAINPRFAYAHWALAYLGRQGGQAERATRIRAALADTPAGDPDIAHLHYALFKELDDAGDTDAAWPALAAGAAAKRARVAYDAGAEAALYARLAAATPPGFLPAGARMEGSAADDAAQSRVPVFVLGMPRTGTTLLERILGNHPQIKTLTEVAREAPEVKIVLNHFGGPLGVGPYKRDEVFPRWRADIRELAACPNVYVKLGGLAMIVNAFDFHLQSLPPSSGELANAWRPYVETCIEAFGANRCMFESNFPVDKGACGYPVLFNAFKRLASGASATEKSDLFAGTASRFYRLRAS